MIRLRRESQLCRVRVTKPSHWISSRSVQHILLRSQLLNEGATSANVFGALGLLRGPDRPFPEVCLSVWLDPALHSHIRTQRRDCESQSSMTFFPLSLSLSLSLSLFRSHCDSHGTESKRALFWRAHFWQFRVISGNRDRPTERSSSSAPCYISLEEGGEGD